MHDEEVDPQVRMKAMDAMTHGYLLSENDLPRLFLTFYQYWELCKVMASKEETGEETYSEKIDLKDENNEDSHYDKVFDFSWMVDPFMTGDLYDKLLYNGRSLRFDIIQLSPQWEKQLYDIEKETYEGLKDQSRGMGFCFMYWSDKTKIAARHGIHWRSPQVMNPGVRFD